VLRILRWLLLLAILERCWKYALVRRFFQRALPAPAASQLPLVSILQPILSGDPLLEPTLSANLGLRSAYPVEWIWLVDSEDSAGQRICARVLARHPDAPVQVLLRPAPTAAENPKLAKLIVGSRAATGMVLCVLDDDTQLPDFGLEQCLPWLDLPGAGLVFGLPYYTSFDNFWSSLVAAFVNSQSLTTYLPYAEVSEPVTINGMWYAMRRDVFERIGGFVGLERFVSDDFAVAQRVRSHGLRLIQTSLRHPIGTTVDGPGHYLRLIQRWLIFPRESLMRHLRLRDRALFYGLTLVPIGATWLALAGLAYRHTRPAGLAYLIVSNLIALEINRCYLDGATPIRRLWLYPLVQILLPAQALAALIAPRRITWRGRVIRIERGGTLPTMTG
jgi:ceramide glucosyltransferase